MGGERIRFAWWPVRLWENDYGPFVRPTWSIVWLKRVHEVKTFDGDWVAYVDNQHKAMEV